MSSEFRLSTPIKVSDGAALRCVAILVLHVILFHRVAGNVTAGSLVVDGDVEVPFVSDAAACHMIKAKADEVVRVARASQDGTTEIRVSIHRRAPTPSKSKRTSDLDGGSPNLAAADPTPYPYAWLAHAFAGGMGGAGGAHYTDCPPAAPEQHSEAPMAGQERSDGQEEAELETWRISLVLLDGKQRTRVGLSAREMRSEQLGVQIRAFLSQVLAYVDAEPGLPLQLELGTKAQSGAQSSWRICVTGPSETREGS